MSWPVRNEASLAALAGISRGFDPGEVMAEWRTLLGEPGLVLREGEATGTDPEPLEAGLVADYTAEGFSLAHTSGRPRDHLGVELMFLAHLASRLSQTFPDADREGVRLAGVISGFRRDHLDAFAPQALASLGDRATTAVLVAVPGLATGFLTALEAVAAGSGDPAR